MPSDNLLSQPTRLNQLEPVLRLGDWQFCLCPHTPQQFQLFYRQTLMFEGSLAITCNGIVLDTDNTSWHHRQKPGRVELWGRVPLPTALTVSLSFTFCRNTMKIEYLARTSPPSRLDICYHVLKIQDPETAVPGVPPRSLTSTPALRESWQRNGVPSPHFCQKPQSHWFGEAFSATQWIQLEKV